LKDLSGGHVMQKVLPGKSGHRVELQKLREPN
jgi:hypothetical protein